MEKKVSIKERLSSLLLSFLEEHLTKFLVMKFAVTGGIRLWLIQYVSSKLIEASDEYLLEPALRKIGYIKDVKNGEIRYVKRVESEDADDWRDSIINR